MLVLDTNVVSELMRPAPSKRVLAWLAARQIETVALTTITVMEIHYGLSRLPQGRRRAALAKSFDTYLDVGFKDRLLPFDLAAAEECAAIRNARDAAGRPISMEDAMIAAIARSRGLTVVTRDRSGFQGCGVPVIDPWNEPTR